jgi:hypothetical protein
MRDHSPDWAAAARAGLAALTERVQPFADDRDPACSGGRDDGNMNQLGQIGGGDLSRLHPT